MEFWQKTCLILCLYGFFKELKPSESFLNKYLTGSIMNFTNEQTTYEIYPVSTYAYLFLLIPVFLLTDILRYKPVLVAGAFNYIFCWVILLWTRGVPWMQVMQLTYAVTTATEVAYYSYIYAQVSGEVYSKVTGYTRAANLAGRCVAAYTGQILITTGAMNPHTLNYLSLGFVSLASVFALAVPPVKHSIYFHRDKSGLSDSQAELMPSDSDPFWSRLRKMYGLLYRDFMEAFSNASILKWSVWWIIASAGSLQVLNYAQSLWKHIDPDQKHVYNGLVDGTGTLLGSLSALSVSRLPLKLDRWGEMALAIFSLLMAGLLLAMGLAGNIYVAYVGYALFRVCYEMLMTIAEYRIATNLRSESYGVLFGVNMFVSLLIQTIGTAVINTWLRINPMTQFVIYGIYFAGLSALFWVITAFARCKKNTPDVETPHKNTPEVEETTARASS